MMKDASSKIVMDLDKTKELVEMIGILIIVFVRENLPVDGQCRNALLDGSGLAAH